MLAKQTTNRTRSMIVVYVQRPTLWRLGTNRTNIVLFALHGLNVVKTQFVITPQTSLTIFKFNDYSAACASIFFA